MPKFKIEMKGKLTANFTAFTLAWAKTELMQEFVGVYVGPMLVCHLYLRSCVATENRLTLQTKLNALPAMALNV
jgi:hypothetical protein